MALNKVIKMVYNIYYLYIALILYFTQTSCRCNTLDDLAAGWKITSATRNGEDIMPLITFPAIGFIPNGETVNIRLPLMDLQPLAKQLTSNAEYKLSCNNDSIIIKDNRYNYFTGRYAIHVCNKRNHLAIIYNHTDTIKLAKITMSGDNWVPITVPD